MSASLSAPASHRAGPGVAVDDEHHLCAPDSKRARASPGPRHSGRSACACARPPVLAGRAFDAARRDTATAAAGCGGQGRLLSEGPLVHNVLADRGLTRLHPPMRPRSRAPRPTPAPIPPSRARDRISPSSLAFKRSTSSTDHLCSCALLPHRFFATPPRYSPDDQGPSIRGISGLV